VFTSILQGVAHFTGGLFYVISLQYAMYAQVNQGVITSIFSLTSFFMTFIGVFMFHEKLKIYHYVGVAFLVLCAVLISMSDDGSKPD